MCLSIIEDELQHACLSRLRWSFDQDEAFGLNHAPNAIKRLRPVCPVTAAIETFQAGTLL